MPHHFQLRLTDAGVAALADGLNRGIRAVSYTRISAGSGFGLGGEADDARTALRNERDSAPVTGTTQVAGELALAAEITASADYDIREVGLWGRIGDDGPEALHAYYTDPAEIFARALSGAKTLIAGGMAVAPAEAEVNVAVSARVTLESQGLLPQWLLPPPHAAAAGHRLAVAAARRDAGGAVSVAAGQKLSLGVPSAAGDTGFSRAFVTPAWASQDLAAWAVYFLRARAGEDGELEIYTQRGAAGDAVPASLRGTPGAAQGGGFASTPLDARIARVATGATGTVPHVARYALDATRAAGIAAWSAAADYAHPAAAWGSDSEMYVSQKSSGPSHGGAADPAKDADRSHWRPALKTAGLSAIAAPAKNDMVRVGVRAAASPGTEGWVEIQKLPGALAPNGGVVANKKYALKALAGGLFELARFSALATLLAAPVRVDAGGSANLGDTLTVPAGSYIVTATAYYEMRRNSANTAYSASLELQWRVPSGNWSAVPGVTEHSASRRITGNLRGSGQLGGLQGLNSVWMAFRSGWVVGTDVEVRLRASGTRNYEYKSAAVALIEEA